MLSTKPARNAKSEVPEAPQSLQLPKLNGPFNGTNDILLDLSSLIKDTENPVQLITICGATGIGENIF